MNDASAAPNPIGRSLSSAELVTTIAHFHRAEIARMAGWRDRLDRTTNWAITVVAAMLSIFFTRAQQADAAFFSIRSIGIFHR